MTLAAHDESPRSPRGSINDDLVIELPDRMFGAIRQRAEAAGLVLRPIRETDLAQLYEWATAPDVARTWRYRGSTPSYPMFVDQLFVGVLAQYACDRGGELVGLCSLYDANLSACHVHLSLLIAPSCRNTLVVMGAFALIAHYGFRTWPLQKMYLECTSASVRLFSSALQAQLVREEARLTNYELFGDEWSDLIYLSIDRPLVDEPGHV